MTPPITIDGCTKRYRDVTAADHLTVDFARGQIHAIVGPNGAGKTTMLDAIAGIIRPDAGTIRVCGFDPWTQREELVQHLAVAPQFAALFDRQTVGELLALWQAVYGDRRALSTVLESCGLGELRDRPVSVLSGGEGRRLVLGLVLVARREVVVLDEPTSSLDPVAREQLWDRIRGLRSSGTTVLLSTHLLDEAEQLADQVHVLSKGQLICSGPLATLIDEHAPSRTLSFSTTARSSVSHLVGERVQVNGTELRCVVDRTKVDAALRELLALDGVDASSIRVERCGLAAVFHNLTGQTITEKGEIHDAHRLNS